MTDDSFDEDDFENFEEMTVSAISSSTIKRHDDCKSGGKIISSNKQTEKFVVMDLEDVKSNIDNLVKRFAENNKLTEEKADVVLRRSDYKIKLAEKSKEINHRKEFNKNSTEKKSNLTTDCQICYEKINTKDGFSAYCGHLFCWDCWHGYLDNIVRTKGVNSAKTKCPEHSCDNVLSYNLIEEICRRNNDNILLKKFHSFKVDLYRTGSNDIINCVDPRCTKYIQRREEIDSHLTWGQCVCGTEFCFECKSESHRPASCENMEDWNKQYETDAMTANYLSVYTKNCPECNVIIEKNRGCNHIICFSCSFEFCWVCMKNWRTHNDKTGGFYVCNIYREMKLRGEKPKEHKPDSQQGRLLFYIQRYQGHKQSLKFATKEKTEIDDKMEEMKHSNIGTDLTDYEYLGEAIDVIKKCRKILMYTYVYRYYLKTESAQIELFEFLQQELEQNTENLHDLVEKPMKDLQRREIEKQTAMTNQYAENLLNGIE